MRTTIISSALAAAVGVTALFGVAAGAAQADTRVQTQVTQSIPVPDDDDD
ncbi:hypothetical protein ACBJ59_44155 [Nonomuraea sp. MTCD27]